MKTIGNVLFEMANDCLYLHTLMYKDPLKTYDKLIPIMEEMRALILSTLSEYHRLAGIHNDSNL
jgi:hypothetical protein